MTVLGIETSCDETSAAVLRDGTVLSNVISSQEVHAHYGGVVPELASRAHQQMIVAITEEALKRADCMLRDVHAVAATHGPGLIGSLLVGLSFAKGLAMSLQVPFVGVNHMEGHLYSTFLASPVPPYPFLCLIVSGGHTMLVLVQAPFEHRVLGQTRDDAAGEAFDKVAIMLGLGYPGGPAIDREAARGNPEAVRFPRAYLEHGSYDFSFSGIKTAVLYHLRDRGSLAAQGSANSLEPDVRADLCASFQEAVVDVLVAKTMHAAREFAVGAVTVAGGVSANTRLRTRLAHAAEEAGIALFRPAGEYCIDNAAMIAYAGWLKLIRGMTSPLSLPAVPNLSLSAAPAR